MTHKQKWAKHARLSAKANRLYQKWQDTCREINALLMTDTPDNPHRRMPPGRDNKPRNETGTRTCA